MNQTVLPPSSVRDYVQAVRAELSDLAPDDVDDLVGGLEADLSERASELPEGTDLAAAFGSPEAYAAELRSAADLPPRVVTKPTQAALFAFEEARLRSWRLGLTEKHGWLRDLRPVWWLVRGAALALPLLIVLGVRMEYGGLASLVLLGAGAVASFVWGRRGTQAVSSWSNRLTLLGNAAAVLLLLPLALYVTSPRVEYFDSGPGAYPMPQQVAGPDGVWVNGESASNLYAYDAQGNRIDNVRLFNQYGQALSVPADALLPWTQQPGQSEVIGPNGQVVKDPIPMTPDGQFDVNRSVFPLRWSDLTGWQASLGGWEPPVRISELRVSPAEPAAPSASPSPAVSTSPGPQDSTSPSPSPSATS